AALWAIDSGTFDDTVATGSYEVLSLWNGVAVGPGVPAVVFEAEDPVIESDTFSCFAQDGAAALVRATYTTSPPYACTVEDLDGSGAPPVVVDTPNPNGGTVVVGLALQPGASTRRAGAGVRTGGRARVELRGAGRALHGATSVRLRPGRHVEARIPIDRALRRRLARGDRVPAQVRISMPHGDGRRWQTAHTVMLRR
ncbi:MAG TPA: hypothetical protein VFR97_08495, partial [Capillimicrobium sp.]|nr:hypothetical protein [Capillimicrobium sp.]